jgi:hypothetical protein
VRVGPFEWNDRPSLSSLLLFCLLRGEEAVASRARSASENCSRRARAVSEYRDIANSTAVRFAEDQSTIITGPSRVSRQEARFTLAAIRVSIEMILQRISFILLVQQARDGETPPWPSSANSCCAKRRKCFEVRSSEIWRFDIFPGDFSNHSIQPQASKRIRIA